MGKNQELEFTKLFSKWYGWDSPVGPGLLIVSISLSILLCAMAVNQFANAGNTGNQILKEAPKEIVNPSNIN